MRRRLRPPTRTVRRLLAGLVVVIAGLGIATVVTTGTEVQRLAFLAGPDAVRAPAWSRPCWRPRTPPYTLPCARVRGRVIYREPRDPDGDGDRHLVVVAGLALVTLKIPASDGPISVPGIGRRVIAAGRYEHGTGRLGSDVVDVSTLQTP